MCYSLDNGYIRQYINNFHGPALGKGFFLQVIWYDSVNLEDIIRRYDLKFCIHIYQPLPFNTYVGLMFFRGKIEMKKMLTFSLFLSRNSQNLKKIYVGSLVSLLILCHVE